MKIIIDIPEEYYKAIKEIPIEQSTADMLIIRNGTEPKTGRWIKYDYDERGYSDIFKCSECKNIIQYHCHTRNCDYNFCPNCGADMTEPTKADMTESEVQNDNTSNF